MTLDTLVQKIEAPQKPPTVEVDMSDIFGESVVFVYRVPSLYDLYSIADPKVLHEWRVAYPDMPDLMAQQLELYARLHVAPETTRPKGEVYVEILNKLDTSRAVKFIRKIEEALTPFINLKDFDQLVEEKKGR